MTMNMAGHARRRKLLLNARREYALFSPRGTAELSDPRQWQARDAMRSYGRSAAEFGAAGVIEREVCWLVRGTREARNSDSR